MPRIVIALDPRMIVTRIPAEGEDTMSLLTVQQKLIREGRVFDLEGNPISKPKAAEIREDNLLSKDHLCVPQAGILRLMSAIAKAAAEKSDLKVEFLLLDPKRYAVEPKIADVMISLVKEILGAKFEIKDDVDSIEPSSQENYMRECDALSKDSRKSIRQLLEEYKTERGKGRQVPLPIEFFYFYLESEDTRAFNEAKRKLANQLSTDIPNKDIDTILNELYPKRLLVSLAPVLQAWQTRLNAEKVVLLTSSKSHGKSTKECDGMTSVLSGDVVQLIENTDTNSRVVRANLDDPKLAKPFVETMLAAMSIFDLVSIFCGLKPENQSAEGELFSGQRMFITNPAILEALSDVHDKDHPGLKHAFSAIANSLRAEPQSSLLSHAEFQRAMEAIVAYFTCVYRNRPLKQRQPYALMKLIPDQIIESFQRAISFNDEPDMLCQLFFLWLAGGLERFKSSGHSGEEEHVIRDLIQVMTSAIEKAEIKERLVLVFRDIDKALAQENKAQNRANIIQRVGLAISNYEADKRELLSFSTKSPIKERNYVRNAPDDAGGRPRASSETNSVDIHDLNLLGVSPDNSEEVRVETWILTPDNIGDCSEKEINQIIETFLQQHLRLNDKPNKNVQPVLAVHPSGDVTVEAILIEEGHTRKYYRSNKQGNVNALSEGAPIVGQSILKISSKIVEEEPEIDNGDPKRKVLQLKCIFGVRSSDVYLGKRNEKPSNLSEVDWPVEAIQPEEGLFTKIYKRLIALRDSKLELKSEIDEVLTLMDNLKLLEHEAAFLAGNYHVDSPDKAELIQDLKRAYEFIQSEANKLFSYQSEGNQLRANLEDKGQVYLALTNLLLGAGGLITFFSIAFGSGKIAVTMGDIFFYISKKNTTLMRLSDLAVFILMPAALAQSWLGPAANWVARWFFYRRLPKSIGDLLFRAYIENVTAPARLSGAFEKIIQSRSGIAWIELPDEVYQFQYALKRFAQFTENSTELPPALKDICMQLVKAAQKNQGDGSKKSNFDSLFKRLFRIDAFTILVKTFGVIVMAIVAGICFGLLDINGPSDLSLSSLTRSSIDALFLATVFVCNRLFLNTAEAGVRLWSSRSALFGSSRQGAASERTAPADDLEAGGNDGPSQSAATDTTPLDPTGKRANRPRPRRGCPFPCAIS